MSLHGFHYALSRDDAKALFAARTEEALIGFFDELARRADLPPERKEASQELWDPIHRVLTDGTLDRSAGEYPLNHVILGGRAMQSGPQGERLVSMVRPDAVAHVAQAMAEVKSDWFGERYFRIPADAVQVNDDGFRRAWAVFERLQRFFQQAAADRHAVLFVAK